MVKHYLRLSAITSKVTKFTTIETIHILVFLTIAFPTLALMFTTTCFYSSLAIFGTFSLTLLYLETYAPRILVLDIKASFISFSA